jgi:hypothetical protein
MQHYTRQGQFEKACNDKGLEILKMNAERNILNAYMEDGELYGYFSDKVGGAIAEDNWERKCLESEFYHLAYWSVKGEYDVTL